MLATVARRVGAPGDAFEPIDGLSALPASAKLLGPGMDVSVELVRIVERRHHNVSTLPPIRVVAVVRNDPAGNGVVIWIHHGHAGSIRPLRIAGRSDDLAVDAPPFWRRAIDARSAPRFWFWWPTFARTRPAKSPLLSKNRR